MKLGFYNFYRAYNGNRMFQNAAADIGDDLIYPAVYLGKRLKELGHEVATIDTAPLESFDAVTFFDFPTMLNPYYRKLIKLKRIPFYLFINENPIIRPDNWNPANHVHFTKVFTWDPALADGKKYIRLRITNKLPDYEPYAPSQADKFCCLIASQKYSNGKGELYSERVRAIRWFEKNHPDEFDLYGQRWDRFFFQGPLSLANPFINVFYSKLPWLPRRNFFPSFRGSVKVKRGVMRQYKFSICYENACYPGYLTEKILDALFAGCVPVYLGDPRVTELIPPQAFIDKNKFPDYDSLYRHLKAMSAEEYESHRRAIHAFVHGEGIKPIGPEAVVEAVVNEIVNPLKSKS